MPTPLDTKLYDYVKSLASKKFKSPSGIYRSSWIVREYKKLGGKYSGPKPTNSGLVRWFNEKWVDLKRPIKDSKNKLLGYEKCGRKSANSKGNYPLCRPSIRINSKTPKTYKELSKSSIEDAKKKKKNYKNIVFKKN